MNNLASLSAETLASLAPPTDSKNDLVQSFVESQKAHAKAYAKEGRNFASTWDCSTPERQLDDALPLDKSAFATPVLKPRVARPEIHSELDQSISALSIRNSDESPHRVGPHQKRQISSKAKKQNQQLLITSTGKENNAEQKASKRIDEQQEHAARLAERRERKRAKRAIVQPAEIRTGDEAESDNCAHGRSSRKRKPSQTKTKIPQGLALLYGFTAANVGATRLTFEPPAVGVFNKGKASAKAIVPDKKSRQNKHKKVFSEAAFLDKAQKKSKKGHPPPLALPTSESVSDCSGTSGGFTKKRYVITNRLSSKKLKSQSEGENERRVDSTSICEKETKSVESNHDGTRQRVESEIWDIERDDYPVESPGSPVSQRNTVVLNTRAFGWSKSINPVSAVVAHGDPGTGAELELHTNNRESRSSTLAPSDSASRRACLDAQRAPPVTMPGVTSRYFAHASVKTGDLACTDSGAVPPTAISTSQEIIGPTPQCVADAAQDSDTIHPPTTLDETPVLADEPKMGTNETEHRQQDRPGLENQPSSPNSLERALAEYDAEEYGDFRLSQPSREIHMERMSESIMAADGGIMGEDFECGYTDGIFSLQDHEINCAPSIDVEEDWKHAEEHANSVCDSFDSLADTRFGMVRGTGPSSPYQKGLYVEAEEPMEFQEEVSEGDFENEDQPNHLEGSFTVPMACSDASSDTTGEHDYPTDQFSQGRALLLGIEAPKPRGVREGPVSKVLNPLARAEENVARALRYHWRPNKL